MVFDRDFDISLYQMLMSGYKRDEILAFVNLLPSDLLQDIRNKLIKKNMTYDEFEYVSKDGLIYKVSIDCECDEKDITIELKFTDVKDRDINYVNYIKSLMLTKDFDDDFDDPYLNIGNYEETIQVFGTNKPLKGYEPFIAIPLGRSGFMKRDEVEYNLLPNDAGFTIECIHCTKRTIDHISISNEMPKEISIPLLNERFGKDKPKKLVRKPD